MSKSELIFLDGRLLVLFCTLAEELHFARAAARLFMTQPPLTQQIKRLEAIVGVPLFERTTRSVALTPAGEIMYERARKIAADTQLMLRQARRTARGETGTLVIGITPSAASSPLVSALSHYRDAHPEVRIDLREMNSVDMEAALRSRVVDVALMRPHPLDADILTRVIYEEPLRVALRRDHALAHQRDVSLEELLEYPLVGYRQDISPYFRNMIQALFARAQLKPEIAQESVIPTLLTLVEAGIGPALVPQSLSRMRSDSLCFLPLRDVTGATAQVVVAAMRKQGNPAVEGFSAALAQAVGRR
ncbi:Hca operon transcriptional activator HcaR [Achromobacter insolitus]|uniref:LysR substrate-binding domain-containing protein n=1 Tax=Achromobacter insolitus TaxID=217204 RepID=UPI000CEB6771|nr:LysR substrate-binding domain-containing protein [Achromobacter insolitus]GLK94107.1 transcriptional regulator [Achromobacter xylosoxidans]AVG38857.1 LysR family transcriptional regulator [Achromobacter insolitus]AXA69537.1 LysR family transcriptional regulator [Achromobacter insolitus]MCP1403885.1 DNA-binding transcriptional LysR family regulator [Achromobacter insolitus]MDQ6217381.1 LysR substrate-binding domain-containing protein [Achromobacter insolitus]